MGILRLSLALAVVLSHVGPIFGPFFCLSGEKAVDTFFAISGFYMALILRTRYSDNLPAFYFNRFLRVFPIFWLILSLAILCGLTYWMIVGIPIGPIATWKNWNGDFPRVAWISNLAIIGSDVVLFKGRLDGQTSGYLNQVLAIQPAWTLSVEISFYLVAPFLMRLRLRTQAAIFIVAAAFRVLVYFLNDWQWSIWTNFYPPSTWVFFLSGVLSYQLMEHLERSPTISAKLPGLGKTALGALICYIAVYSLQTEVTATEPPEFIYHAIIFLSLPAIFSYTRSSQTDARIGEWSYPIYLAHWIAIGLTAPIKRFTTDTGIGYVALVATILISYFALRIDRYIQLRFKRIL